jgi:hypothetical protein
MQVLYELWNLALLRMAGVVVNIERPQAWISIHHLRNTILSGEAVAWG